MSVKIYKEMKSCFYIIYDKIASETLKLFSVGTYNVFFLTTNF